jgi:hypothetical protein
MYKKYFYSTAIKSCKMKIIFTAKLTKDQLIYPISVNLPFWVKKIGKFTDFPIFSLSFFTVYRFLNFYIFFKFTQFLVNN